MPFIDDWRHQIPASLSAFAGLIAGPEDVQLGFFAAAVLWPIHEIAIDDAVASLALRQIVGDYADRVLALIRAWPDDPRAAAEDLAQRAAGDVALQGALTQLVSVMLAPTAATDPLGGAVMNFIVHIGDTISVADVANANVNIKSSLTDVEQRIDAAAAIDEDTKALLRQLIAQVAAHAPPKPLFWKLITIGASMIGVASGIVGLYLGVPQILNPPRTPVPINTRVPTAAPLPTSTPVRRLNGDINIAVAVFGALDAQGRVVQSQEAADLAGSVYNRLDQEIRALGTLTDPFDIDRLAPQDTGPITGTTREERAQSAEQLAHAINADIIIYGNLKPGAAEFIPEFYISDKKLIQAHELAGQYELGSSINGGGDIAINPVARKQLTVQLLTRTQTLVQFIIGLGYYALDKVDDAETYFRSAENNPAWGDRDGKEVLYLLLGNVALVREDWPAAQTYYDRALHLNPSYARAQLGAAEIALANVSQNDCQPGSVDSAVLGQAIQRYRDALAAPLQPALSDIPTKGALGLGRAYLCMSLAQIADRFSDAEVKFTQVITTYDGGNQRVKELAAQAYFGRAQIFEQRGEYRRAAQEYQAGVGLTLKPINQAIVYVSLAQIYLQTKECDESARMLKLADAAYDRVGGRDQKSNPGYERRRKIIGDDVANASCAAPTSAGA